MPINNGALASHGPWDESLRVMKALVQHDEQSLAVEGTSTPSAGARLDAVRVLVLALNATLEDRVERDVEAGPPLSFYDEVQRFEATLIRSALVYTGGRQRRAARLLSMNVATLNSKIKRYKISSE